MSDKEFSFDQQAAVLAGIIIALAFIGGGWLMAFRHLSRAPETVMIAITLPAEQMTVDGAVVELPERVVEVERAGPDLRKYFTVLLHPFGWLMVAGSILGSGIYILYQVAKSNPWEE